MSRTHVFTSAFALLLLASATGCGSDEGDDGSSGAGGSAGTSGAAGTAGTGGGAAGAGGTGGGAAGTGGTGGGSAGASGGSIGSCATACANLATPNCPQEPDEPACTADCEKERALILGCEAEHGALAGCYSTAQVTCDTDGYAQAAGCDDLEFAHLSCIACTPATDDDACDTCVKQSCCDQAKTVFTDPGFDAYLDCASSCSDEGCVNGCTTSYPTAAAALDAFNQCQDANCMEDCL